MRLDKPVGIWLTFFPAAWVLAAQQAEVLYFILFLLGALVMRSAGCIINDLTDRKYDTQVERTKSRPLAANTVPVKHVYILLAVLLCIGFGIVLVLPFLALPLAFATFPLIIVYPWMKRITWWPQLFLGITFNMGALFASIATTEIITTLSVLFYVASIFWTLGYDTVYALQDKHDDTLIGVKSTALKLGTHVTHFVLGSYALMAACFTAAGMIYATLLACVHGGWQVWRVIRGADGGRIFRSNQWLGLAIFAVLLLTQ